MAVSSDGGHRLQPDKPDAIGSRASPRAAGTLRWVGGCAKTGAQRRKRSQTNIGSRGSRQLALVVRTRVLGQDGSMDSIDVEPDWPMRSGALLAVSDTNDEGGLTPADVVSAVADGDT